MDTLIIEQLKQGKEEAFRYIYKQHYVLLCRFANQMLEDAMYDMNNPWENRDARLKKALFVADSPICKR